MKKALLVLLVALAVSVMGGRLVFADTYVTEKEFCAAAMSGPGEVGLADCSVKFNELQARGIHIPHRWLNALRYCGLAVLETLLDTACWTACVNAPGPECGLCVGEFIAAEATMIECSHALCEAANTNEEDRRKCEGKRKK